MTFPGFYNPDKVGRLFAPDTSRAVDEGRLASVPPSSNDRQRVILLLVDTQVDFVHTDGALSVPGAVDDTRRTIEWLFRNLGQVTTIAASLDSHVPIQIFSPTWWRSGEGEHPAPFTVISSGDVQAGKWRPLYEPEWSVDYVEKLEEQAKKQLMIWPYHTLIGTPGHSITPALYEAIACHSAARQSQPVFLTKGSIAKTEHYSILEPEAKVPDQPLGSLNTAFLDMLASYDLVYIAGQAKSHCVLETVTSTMRYFHDQPDVIAKLRVLMDCISSVAHPEIDFDAMANETFARYAKQGLMLAESTQPLG
jgi:nicotinamidase-related amidase